MPNDAGGCPRCGTSFDVPKNMDPIAAKVPNGKGLPQEPLFLCPPCRAQTFAERTIGRDLQRLSRIWPLPKRRSEQRRPIRFDPRTGATVYKSQCYICNSGCDALVYEKSGQVIRGGQGLSD